MKRLNDTAIRRSVVLSGTRRVGKTTIEYQMIEALLNSGVSPQKILFISMDHPMLKLSSISDILECYHSNVYPDQDVYYFFYEVQYAADWEKWLKIIFDMQPDTHVVATGSASPVLIKGSQESGAGRWTVIQVPTMSFYEYCELIGVDKPALPENLKISSLLYKHSRNVHSSCCSFQRFRIISTVICRSEVSRNLHWRTMISWHSRLCAKMLWIRF